MILFEIISVLISYIFLFDHRGCANNINRTFMLFGNEFTILYPEMCDELFYFHGFQWINHIYENGYVYQDRPLYLLIGFVVYRFLFVFSFLLNFQIDPLSLLLLTSLIIQLVVVNFISYFLCKLLINKFDKFYFLVFFLITIFSFETRIYLFFPSSSIFYLLIFIYSLYSIKNNKYNGLVYGLLFTISGYGIIGFAFESIKKIYSLKKELNNIIKNILLFTIPSLFFELVRISLGIFQGPQYGIKYIHAANDYQQFTWVFNTIFTRGYEPISNCHTFKNFIPCYFELTSSFFSKTSFYILFCLVLFVFYLFKKNRSNTKDLITILSFTFFCYLFISFQGLYQYRFIYYSIGFSFVVLICYFVFQLKNDFISLGALILLSTYTLSRDKYENFNLILREYEIAMLLFFLIIVLLDVFILDKQKS